MNFGEGNSACFMYSTKIASSLWHCYHTHKKNTGRDDVVRMMTSINDLKEHQIWSRIKL